MSTLEKSVEKSFEGRKIREYLKEEMGLSSRLIRGAAMDKRISVNNTPVRMNYILKENDNIVINLNKKEVSIVYDSLSVSIDEIITSIENTGYMVIYLKRIYGEITY